jgi:hypothetical protein
MRSVSQPVLLFAFSKYWVKRSSLANTATMPAAKLNRHLSGSDQVQFHPLPGRRRLVRKAWHRHPPRLHRQRPFYKANRFAYTRKQLGLTQRRTPRHPAHQRQGRTLYQDRHQRVALRPYLPELRRKKLLTSDLDSSVQLASTPRQPQPTTTHQ